ncbi:hypothetical protein QX204_14990 [Nocardia sp. PE-7]|uniref:hypothetical protein n=1 Tax=Nocardia sp. PE-7 TaxID=3058426 RepID=UPI00265B20F0|nr:hypothetical protein [Nocardia sp. PE-7]WKG12696.1 hypothetical protein QX204_14990 [Nocardia sp. PE-7]
MSEDHLTHCQDWILTSLCRFSPTTPITTPDLASKLSHSVVRTEVYLEQLVEMGLVRVQHVSGEPAWRQSSEGLTIGTVV